MKDHYVVSKSNKLVKARYSLTLQEKRFIESVASLISPIDEDFKEYEIAIKDFIQLFDMDQNSSYRELRKITKQLLSKPFEIVDTNQEDGTQKIIQMNWFSKITYSTGKGIITCSFDPVLKPYLLQLKAEFTSYKLENITSLTSSYSIRLYEILKSIQGLKKKIISVEELRELLQLGNQYPNYGNLKIKILNPAINEINKLTDITAKFEETKKGRKISFLKFSIRAKPSKAVEIKAVDAKKLVIVKARECYSKHLGNCGATWENYKSSPDSICYNCEKFKVARKQLQLI